MKDSKIKTSKKFQKHAKDTWSTKVQISLLSERIKQLTEHLKTHKKDFDSRLWLVKLAWRRRKLLDYLQGKNKDDYQEIVALLGLRTQNDNK